MIDLTNIFTSLFSHVCHQIPDRSFSFLVFGGKSIVCARCTGMYLGLLFGVTRAVVSQNINNALIIKMLFGSVIILIIEMIAENIVAFPFGNIARFTTGIIFGVSVGIGTMRPIKKHSLEV